MTILITLVIIIITFAYITYPFFRKSAVASVAERNISPMRIAIEQVKKTGRKQRDIDSEIEKRISEIRKKDKTACPDCGASYREGSRFCSQCGADLSAK